MIRYCNRCGCPRGDTVGICPECGCPEFSHEPDATHRGWQQRQPAIAVQIPWDDGTFSWDCACKGGSCGTREVDDMATKEEAEAKAKELGWKNGICRKCQQKRSAPCNIP